MQSIQEVIVRALLYAPEYTRKVYPYLKEEFFDGHYKIAFRFFKELYDAYDKIPSMEAMLVKAEKTELTEDMFQEVVGLLETVYKNRKEAIDVEWLIDESEEYCRDKASYNAVYEAIEIIEGNSKKKLSRNAIPDLFEEATSISFKSNLGSDYFRDRESRYQYYTEPERKLFVPLNALQRLTNGGFPRKTLNMFLAGPNVGKSSIMCFLAGEYLKNNKNVLYISGEMSEEMIGERIDANLLDITTDQLKSGNLDKDWFEKKIKALEYKTTGTFKYKEYPTGMATATHIRSLLKDLKQTEGFVPDIIFLDYVNIFGSAKYTGGNVNSYTLIKSVGEEMRAIAVEWDLPMVTATQVNREGSNSMQPDMANISESFGTNATVDWLGAIVTSDELMEMDQQVMYTIKTRYGNKKNCAKAQIIGVDFDKMRYYDVSSKSAGESEPQQPQGPGQKETAKDKDLTDWDM